LDKIQTLGKVGKVGDTFGLNRLFLSVGKVRDAFELIWLLFSIGKVGKVWDIFGSNSF
jgi:hypothetical protein